MAKQSVAERVSNLLADFLKDNNLEIYKIQFAKEGKDRFLRVFIDKLTDKDEEYVSTDDCELVSRFLSDKLDEEDVIQGKYYLEISSPGMDRELIHEKDFKRFANKIVDVSLYKGIDGKKQFQGKLMGLTNGKVVIVDENEKELSFSRDEISKIKLAIIF